MLLLIPLVLIFSLGASAAPVVQEPVVVPLRWSTPFGSHFVAGSELELSWSGGEGVCEVYYVPRWPGQREYDLLTIDGNATEGFTWNVPTFDDYPKGTTFILGIKGSYQPRGADWYDLSPALPLLSEADGEKLDDAARAAAERKAEEKQKADTKKHEKAAEKAAAQAVKAKLEKEKEELKEKEDKKTEGKKAEQKTEPPKEEKKTEQKLKEEKKEDKETPKVERTEEAKAA